MLCGWLGRLPDGVGGAPGDVEEEEGGAGDVAEPGDHDLPNDEVLMLSLLEREEEECSGLWLVVGEEAQKKGECSCGWDVM